VGCGMGSAQFGQPGGIVRDGNGHANDATYADALRRGYTGCRADSNLNRAGHERPCTYIYPGADDHTISNAGFHPAHRSLGGDPFQYCAALRNYCGSDTCRQWVTLGPHPGRTDTENSGGLDRAVTPSVRKEKHLC